jgi:hydroxymethylpyrimidine kinase/phosphomethylpyrimidine kinase
MLFSRRIVEAVADYLAAHPVPLVVDPVMVASSGAKLLEDDAVEALTGRLFPLATVVTPNLMEAQALVGEGTRRELAERLVGLGAAAAIVTGGHGDDAVDHLFDGERHVEIPVDRHAVAATHGAGCTHSATLAALLARGETLEDAARGAARAAFTAEPPATLLITPCCLASDGEAGRRTSNITSPTARKSSIDAMLTWPHRGAPTRG